MINSVNHSGKEMARDYESFLKKRSQTLSIKTVEPSFIPDKMMDFQRYLVGWALATERAALFADCGMGKSLMSLTWAQNVYLQTGKPVLILTPLAVGSQFVREGQKFGIDCA
jgi:SNF2 family DNA or RNA helicase